MTRYLVEWCSEMPVTEHGDADVDRAKYTARPVPSFARAVAFAKELLRKKADAFGSIEVDEQELRVDEDILEHEGRTVKKWESLRRVFVDDLEFEYTEKELEHVQQVTQ